jgi:hypothetical protein
VVSRFTTFSPSVPSANRARSSDEFVVFDGGRTQIHDVSHGGISVPGGHDRVGDHGASPAGELECLGHGLVGVGPGAVPAHLLPVHGYGNPMLVFVDEWLDDDIHGSLAGCIAARIIPV